MEFCPHCRRMVQVRRKVEDDPEANERHVKTMCASCQQLIFEAVRPLDEEEPKPEKKPRPNLDVPIKHRRRRPRPKRRT